ncbi:MAG: helix-turn-helix domain-containing protein [Chloroflexi bacterium]|nr:helix-turn-helix domain-containing protein [Chloroflexota bacterium]
MSTSTPILTLTDQDQLLTAAQAARLLGVHLSTVRRWIARGKLPAYRVGDKGVRVRYDDVLALLSPLNREKGGPVTQVKHIAERFLTEEEKRRGLEALDELELLDRELGEEPLTDSTELIRQMREERTAELMRTLKG